MGGSGALTHLEQGRALAGFLGVLCFLLGNADGDDGLAGCVPREGMECSSGMGPRYSGSCAIGTLSAAS